MRKSKYTESSKLIAVWKMKEIIYNKTKGMDAGDFFQYVNNSARKISERTEVKPANNTIRVDRKRVA